QNINNNLGNKEKPSNNGTFERVILSDADMKKIQVNLDSILDNFSIPPGELMELSSSNVLNVLNETCNNAPNNQNPSSNAHLSDSITSTAYISEQMQNTSSIPLDPSNLSYSSLHTSQIHAESVITSTYMPSSASFILRSFK